MEPVTLTTERLLLRMPAHSDADAVYVACQDPDIPRWTTVPSPYTRDDALHWVCLRVPEGWRGDTGYSFGVFLRDSGVLVGTIGLLRLQKLHEAERQAELGYWTAKDHRRRGYTVEAGRAVCGWAFRDLGVERLEWVAEAGNEGSRAVAKKIGFVMEGTQRSKITHADTRRDAWTGSLLPSDWALAQRTPYLPHPADRPSAY